MSDTTLELMQKLGASTANSSGEHLKVLGEKAASMWAGGGAPDLNSAVLSVVKTASLRPEHIKRVVEFTNTAAYLTEFRKEGSPHHFVDFGKGGPANFAVVLQDLNMPATHHVDTSLNDYHQLPSQEKTASAWEEQSLAQLFGAGVQDYPEENPLGEAIALRDKLGSDYTQATTMITHLEGAYDDLRTRIFGHVKQAALSGHSLGEIAQIWAEHAPTEEHVKVAFDGLYEPLVTNGVFNTTNDLVESLTKQASVGVVNKAHPLVGDFVEFCDVLSKLAETRTAQQEFGEGQAQLTSFLKSAAAGDGLLLQGVNHGVGMVGKAHGAGEWVGKKLLNDKMAPYVGGLAAAGAVAIPALAAHEAYRRTLKHNPTFQAVKGTALGAIPGTEEYRNKELELQMAAQGGYPGGY